MFVIRSINFIVVPQLIPDFLKFFQVLHMHSILEILAKKILWVLMVFDLPF